MTREVMVGTAATPLRRGSNRASVEVQNNGPQPIYVAVGVATDAALGKARKIEAGGAWAVETSQQLFAVTTVVQVTGSATVVTEVGY